MLKQLHIVPDLAISSGGLGLAALRFSESVANAGSEVILYAGSKNDGASLKPTAGISNFSIQIHDFNDNARLKFFSYFRVINDLCKKNKIDLIHMHGVWLPLFVVAALVAKRRKIPYIISPHGCYEPWALKFKSLKKRIALYSYQGLVNRGAAMFFATAEQECRNIRNLGITQAVALIPNGVDHFVHKTSVGLKQRKTFLFLSRIHPKKGLLNLVEAWARVRRVGWQIVIAGPDEANHRVEVEKSISKLGLNSDFTFIGPVEGVKKNECFLNADVFVLPTYSENFGIAVAEALAFGLPVITTTGAPWEALVKTQSGWWVTPDPDGIAKALEAAMDTSEEDLQSMGKRGRNLVAENYSWDKIGRDTLNAYRWIVGKAAVKPCFIKSNSENV